MYVCVYVCVHACVCVCGWNELEVCTPMACPHQFSLYYASVDTHQCIFIPFEDCELTELKVDIAVPPIPPPTHCDLTEILCCMHLLGWCLRMLKACFVTCSENYIY